MGGGGGGGYKKKCDLKKYVMFYFNYYNDAWGRERLQVKKDFLKPRS